MPNILSYSSNDEWATPREAVIPITKHLKKGSRIWCPFDTEESEFYKVLSEHGHSVTPTHIRDGRDFFKLARSGRVSTFDYIISNPPYSKKTEVISTLYEVGVPFAILINAGGVFDSDERFYYVQKYGCEIMYLYPRVRYIQMDDGRNNPPFQSAYFCHNVLSEKLMFERVKK